MSAAPPRLSEETAALVREAEAWLARQGLTLDAVVAQVEQVLVGLAGGSAPPSAPRRDPRP